jgi:hypothetical protein
MVLSRYYISYLVFHTLQLPNLLLVLRATNKMAATTGVYRYSVTKDDGISVEHVPKDPNMCYPQRLNISFQRTIRVPGNADEAKLPPGLGNFPLFKVRDFASKLPTDMVAKGGVFFPMYQRESMWIDITAKYPFMIKIYAGGVNVCRASTMSRLERPRCDDSILFRRVRVSKTMLWCLLSHSLMALRLHPGWSDNLWQCQSEVTILWRRN